MDPILDAVHELVEEIGDDMFIEELPSDLLIEDEDDNIPFDLERRK